MSSNETVYLINSLLNHVAGTALYTQPSSLWLGFMYDVPTQTYFPELPNTNNYRRAQIILGTASSKQITNTNTISFPVPSASWGTIMGYGIWDSQFNGNCLYILQENLPYVINSQFTMMPGALIIGDIY